MENKDKKQKVKFALDVSGLSTYTEQESDLIRSAIMEGDTVKRISVVPNVYSAKAINILGGTYAARLGGTCTFTDTGSTSLTQRTITVCDIAVDRSYCPETLKDYWTAYKMKAGAYNIDLVPFQDIIEAREVSLTKQYIDDLIWRGNTATGGGTPSMALCQGFLQLFTSLTATTVNVSGASLTSSNIVATVFSAVTNIPDNIRMENDLTLFISPQNYWLYIQALQVANYPIIAMQNQVAANTCGTGGNWEICVPGTNVKMVATRGLTNQASFVLTNASNLYFGTDLESDFQGMKFIQATDGTMTLRGIIRWKQGVQVAFPENVVQFRV